MAGGDGTIDAHEDERHHGVNCEFRQRDGHQQKVCVMVNSSDVSGGNRLEALIDIESTGDDNDVFIDYISLHMRRGSNQWQMKETFGPNWVNDNTHWSTDWFEGCQGNYPIDFKAIARYKVRWNGIAGDPEGTFHIQESGLYVKTGCA